MHEFFYKFIYLIKNHKILSELKDSYIKIVKALPVVCTGHQFCTTDRGLHFPGNWFKNKVPHHPAPQM